ncbi:hypothetical protein DUNSADRAFT_11998 [Dunaliella salina]|uniref:ABC transporter domain-containing protein n=1 Tax=Dunaliella salina TaxID=3046 RepID=A0ABQ7GC58_DUNSA|nr:hypothetical protein DUNSADRAFT_11998 [Dunaliella salina]|eukprot:KAF5832191.1 hypothetical protein DUNSADRAFT_11998 [Dunaliella salina]
MQPHNFFRSRRTSSSTASMPPAHGNGASVNIEITNPAYCGQLQEEGDVEMGGANGSKQQQGAPAQQQGGSPDAGDASTLLNEVPREKQVTVSLHNVCAYVPVLVTPDSKNQNDGPKERKVLFDCCGVVEPGEVLALMGPSGSGKSTLLQVLGGRSTCRISGDMLFNGAPLTKNVKKRLGFVTQDDVLFAELTVYETLFFSAMLRLPRSWPKQKKLDRVEMVMTILGIQKCRDTIIGNSMMRGVSGGERKRVSIGAELLINPSVLFLDEPTSGLDSTTALKLVQTMRQLASGGRTVIASIHQPSSRLYQQMDKLMLLSEGYILYYGHTLAAAHWLAIAGHPLPFGVSVPDHILDLANGDIPGVDPEHSQAAKKDLIDKFMHRKIGTGKHGIQPADVGGADTDGLPDPKLVEEKSRSAAQAVSTSGSSTSSKDHGREPSSDEEDEEKRRRNYSTMPSSAMDVEIENKQQGKGGQHDEQHHRQQKLGDVDEKGGAQEEQGTPDDELGATWVDQVRYLTIRAMRTRRFAALSIQRILEILFVAILSGLFWFQRGNPQFQNGEDVIDTQIVRDNGGLLFFQLLFMSFSSMFQALFTFPLDMIMLVKERQSSMYRLSAYYLAKILCDLPMDALLPSVFCWILYFMSGLRLEAGPFFANWLSVLLTMFTAQSLGMLIGATITNLKTALSLMTVIVLTIMLVAGFYVSDIPIWIRWLKYISFIFYGYNLLLKIEFGDRQLKCEDFYRAKPDAPPGREYCTVADAEIYQIDVDADYQSVDANVTLEVLVLVGYMLILRAGVYYALVRKTSFGKSSIWDKMKMPSCGNPFANCMNPFQSFMKPVDNEATK